MNVITTTAKTEAEAKMIDNSINAITKQVVANVNGSEQLGITTACFIDGGFVLVSDYAVNDSYYQSLEYAAYNMGSTTEALEPASKPTYAVDAKTFTPGQQVQGRSACDYDCMFESKIIKRTAKFVTIIDLFNRKETKRCKVYTDEQGEYIFPAGQYSMAPIFRA